MFKFDARHQGFQFFLLLRSRMPAIPNRPSLAVPVSLAAVALILCLPGIASACAACRQAAISTVYGAGFVDRLLVLLLPVVLLLVGGLVIYLHGSDNRPRSNKFRPARRQTGGH